MGIRFDGVVTESLAKQIAEQIREAIVDGRLKVDERLPTEAELAARFDVSRPTVREALKRLAAQNLIRSRRGPTGGTFVARPSLEDASQALTEAATLLVSLGEFTLSDIAEARDAMERTCARLAAARREDGHLERMTTEIAVQRDLSISGEEFCASDVRFHRAVADASGNPVLQFVMNTVIEALQPASNMVIDRFRDRRLAADQHQKLYDAVAAGNANAAEAAVADLMTTLKEQYARAQEWRARKDTGGHGATGTGDA